MNPGSFKTVVSNLYSNNPSKGLITIFTPTFNRGSFLKRIYDCLLKQTDKRFVWLIVNDGSEDNTEDIILNFIEENELPIKYISKKNGGKHSAFETALSECETKYFLGMDDDDLYSDLSIEFFLNEWNKIEKEGSKDIGAIRTIVKRENGGLIIKKPTFYKGDEYVDMTTLEMTYVKNNPQENWTCYKTEYLRNIDLFPKNYWLASQHTFFAETIWQGRFARKYTCRYFPVQLRTYMEDASTSLIRAVKTRKHYQNMFINNKFILEEQLDYIKKKPKTLFERVIIIQLLRGYLGISFKELYQNTEARSLRLLEMLTSPVSLFGNWVIGKRKMKNSKI